MRIAVTGASGFVGGAVCRAAAEAGWQVVGFGRRAGVALPGTMYRVWDLDSGPLADPPEVDAVVHAAATVTDWGPAAPVWRSNVEGTRHVLATFPQARLVHISSSSVYDPSRPTIRATEAQAPVDRYPTAYAATKAAAERLLAGRAGTVVLRPHAIYGPGDRTVLPRVLSAIRGNTLWTVGSGDHLHSLTSVDNLVAAVLLGCRGPVDGVFNVADAEPVVFVEALRALLAERGLRVRIRSLPVLPATALAAAAEFAFRAVRSNTPPRLTRYAIGQIAMERTLDLAAARQRLGLRPTPTSFAGAAHW